MSDKVLPIDNAVMIICPEKGLSDEKIKALKDAAIKALQEKGYYIPCRRSLRPEDIWSATEPARMTCTCSALR